MVRVVQGLVSIATDHAKCLRCHCYREVAEQAIDVARTVGVEGASVAEAVTALKRMLSQVEAGHG